jgi:hypothetical protein
MDARRFNDTMKLVGALGTGLALFSPVLLDPPADAYHLVLKLLASVPAAMLAFCAGVGTRGKGQEYSDVAEAKAIAKMASMSPPPNLSDRPTIPSVPPVSK